MYLVRHVEYIIAPKVKLHTGGFSHPASNDRGDQGLLKKVAAEGVDSQ
jgi:hypothetical protein